MQAEQTVLHLLSNRKWTERAEPVADLVLAQRALGVDAVFVCGRYTGRGVESSSAQVRSREKGLDPWLLEMNKHISLPGALKDVPRLRRRVDGGGVSVLHAHMENAHLLSALTVLRRPSRPLLVRSSYEDDGPRLDLRTRWLLRRFTDGLVVISDEAREATLRRIRLPPQRVAVIEPGIDLSFFAPDRVLPDGRASFGLADSDFVVGMVSRIRTDRKIDAVVEAVARLAGRLPNLRLLLVGRGEEVPAVRALVEARGLGGVVRMPGYCRGDRLAAAFRAMDVLAYPAPGTDRSCRTVREAMASGCSVIAAPVGFLPRLIDPGTTGLLAEATPEAIAGAIETCWRDRAALQVMRAAALRAARERFSLERQARLTLAFYAALRSST